MIAVSGGSDSDIMIDMFERIGYPKNLVTYCWFDTGLEYEATKRHLRYLEDKYDIEIKRYRPKMTVAQATKKYGVPFIGKTISGYIGRLQKHNFQFEEGEFQELYDRYPKCKAALRFWCNNWGEKSSFNISRNSMLKEFIVSNPPPSISDKCCHYAKKLTADRAAKELEATLNVVGVRRAEGGGESYSIYVLFF